MKLKAEKGGGAGRCLGEEACALLQQLGGAAHQLRHQIGPHRQ